MRVMNCYSGKDKKVKLIALGNALLEEHSPEGIGSYAAIINSVDKELSERMKNFLEDIGYIGFSNFDMKYDPRDGQYKLCLLYTSRCRLWEASAGSLRQSPTNRKASGQGLRRRRCFPIRG